MLSNLLGLFVFVVFIAIRIYFSSKPNHRRNDSMMANAGMIRIDDTYYSPDQASELIRESEARGQILDLSHLTPKLLSRVAAAHAPAGLQHSPPQAVTHILDSRNSSESGPDPMKYRLFAHCGVNLMAPPGGHSWVRNISTSPEAVRKQICSSCASAIQ